VRCGGGTVVELYADQLAAFVVEEEEELLYGKVRSSRRSDIGRNNSRVTLELVF
jgi:hypothetical protein